MQENDDLERENQALRNRLSRLSQASLHINESLDLDAVLQGVLDSARSLTDASYALSTTLDGSGRVEDFRVSGLSPDEADEKMSFHITAPMRFRCAVLGTWGILVKRAVKYAATGWRSAMLRIDVSAVGGRALRAIRAEPDVMLHAAKVSVWARWFIWLVGVVELAYRPGFWYADDKSYLLLNVPLVAVNGFLHYRLRRNQTVTWRWLLFLSAMDIALITAAVIIGGEFHLFSYAYYPALALFAVVFTSLPLSLAWTTVVAIVYAGVSLTVGSGLDFDAGQEKALLARLMAMYGVVACVGLIARFERVRRQEAMERERVAAPGAH